MPTILIIEDDPYVRRFYERLFRFNKYQVVLAENGLDGLAKAKTLKPQIILLDILMPNMNGLEVLEQLKSNPETVSSDVLMLTNINETETIDKAMNLGASSFLVKSDTSDQDLLDKIEDLLSKHHSTS